MLVPTIKHIFYLFTPQPLRVLFSPYGVRMGGWAGGQAGVRAVGPSAGGGKKFVQAVSQKL